MQDPNAVTQFAIEILQVALARGIAVEDAVTAMGTAAKALAVHADLRDPQRALVTSAPALLVKGYAAQVVVAGADMTRLADMYAAEDAAALTANAQMRVVKPSIH